ncbi:hypothetical protein DFS33DRAFT_1272459 [Desarmillaria ectypa]|nr:hypothetical protein DFS33DRAFT_1272459 [Desarmillaria ectypa]
MWAKAWHALIVSSSANTVQKQKVADLEVVEKELATKYGIEAADSVASFEKRNGAPVQAGAILSLPFSEAASAGYFKKLMYRPNESLSLVPGVVTIGINAYSSEPLRGCEEDAISVSPRILLPLQDTIRQKSALFTRPELPPAKGVETLLA